jgi:hypothetical protein
MAAGPWWIGAWHGARPMDPVHGISNSKTILEIIRKSDFPRKLAEKPLELQTFISFHPKLCFR